MTDLLDNSLIQKYFGCDSYGQALTPVGMAYEVLQAMQKEIRPGEKYLSLILDGEVVEWVADKDYPRKNNYQFGNLHPTDLRIPDRFQRRDERELKVVQKCKCGEVLWKKYADGTVEAHIQFPDGENKLIVDTCPHGNTCWGDCGMCQKKAQELEDKIKEMTAWMNAKNIDADFWERRLRELVALARR